MNYGEKISHLRKSNGMTQEELGKVLNVTYQAVSKWERGESLPDFATMSQLAKFFEVPLSYFEDGGEDIAEQPEAAANSSPNMVGVCTVCGKAVKEDDEYISSPKLVCKSCADNLEREEIKKKQEEEVRKKYQREREIHEQIGKGFDAQLIVSLVVALAGYILFSVFTFSSKDFADRMLMSLLLFLAPLAMFAITHAVFDLINELRDKDTDIAYTRNLSLIIAAVFAVINIVFFLVIYLAVDTNLYYILLLAISGVASFTFVSQFMWGGVVKDIFTCGGFTFKLPGFIFSLTPESIIMMIITKVLLGILAIIVFIVTTIFFAVVAMLGGVILFIPSVISKTIKDKKVLS